MRVLQSWKESWWQLQSCLSVQWGSGGVRLLWFCWLALSPLHTLAQCGHVSSGLGPSGESSLLIWSERLLSLLLPPLPAPLQYLSLVCPCPNKDSSSDIKEHSKPLSAQLSPVSDSTPEFLAPSWPGRGAEMQWM